MTPHQADLVIARERLLAKLQAMPAYQKQWNSTAMARRIAKMTDEQVATALAMSDEEIAAAHSKADESSRWAPATGDGPTILYNHTYPDWV